jgi:hypothetical protein
MRMLNGLGDPCNRRLAYPAYSGAKYQHSQFSLMMAYRRLSKNGASMADLNPLRPLKVNSRKVDK